MKITKEEYWAKRDAIRENRSLGWDVREQMCDELWEAYCDGLEVGDRANVRFYSDVEPVTVIKRTAKTITVRFDKATLSPDWKPEMVAGGFAAHCVNQETQEWKIEEDPNGSTGVFRRRKNGWYDTGDCKLTPGWRKFYDYNF